MKKKVLFAFLGLVCSALLAINVKLANVSDNANGRVTLADLGIIAYANAENGDACSSTCTGTSCGSKWNSMIEGSYYYCCALRNLWTGNKCKGS